MLLRNGHAVCTVTVAVSPTATAANQSQATRLQPFISAFSQMSQSKGIPQCHLVVHYNCWGRYTIILILVKIEFSN